MKLKFNSDAVYNGKLMFEAGKVYEVEDLDFANRWIRRGAERVIDQEIKLEESLVNDEAQELPVKDNKRHRRNKPSNAVEEL